jgi:hypothetical protein
MFGGVVQVDVAAVVAPTGGEGEDGMKCAECNKMEFLVGRAKSDLAVAARRAARNDSPYNIRQVIRLKDEVLKQRAVQDDHMSWCG